MSDQRWKDLRDKVAKDAARRAAQTTARTGMAAIKSAFNKIGEDFLDFAEKELDEAETVRGKQEGVREKVIRELTEDKQSAKEIRLAREQSARDELARLKAELAKK